MGVVNELESSGQVVIVKLLRLLQLLERLFDQKNSSIILSGITSGSSLLHIRRRSSLEEVMPAERWLLQYTSGLARGSEELELNIHYTINISASKMKCYF